MTSRSRKTVAQQGSLLNGPHPLSTRLIKRKGDFDALFSGFTRMRAVSYVTSPDLLLGLFDSFGYSSIEVVVGDSLADAYRRNLETKGADVTGRLAERVQDGKLLVYVPTRTVHTKLYLLDGPEVCRVIQTSANLTDTAQDARRQVNYAWYVDLRPSDPLLAQLVADYESHKEGCTLFMSDLNELIRDRADIDKRTVIEAWLKGGTSEAQNTDQKRVFHELTQSSDNADWTRAEEPVLVLQIPDVPDARRRNERLLAPMNPVQASTNQMAVSAPALIRYVYENHRVPILRVLRDRQAVLLGIDGTMKAVARQPDDPSAVNAGLGHIESYIHTVDSARSSDPHYARMSLFEALMYIFFAPFAHEYMRVKRAKYGRVDSRGPRFLYIYGPTQNGKSTFLRFALKLLTGSQIEPLSREDFTKTRILNAASVETAFPLIFDDVDPSRTTGLEDIFKSYWERWWQEEYVAPQIVITSNSPRLKDWAKSRVKRVDFDVHFSPTDADKERLNALFSQENHIYSYFTFLYLQRLRDTTRVSSDDELYAARAVFGSLYEFARRPLPEFFPDVPVETVYDPGRRDWRDLIFTLQKVNRHTEGNRLLLTFSGDMQSWEVGHYQGYLPQTIKYQRRGNTLVIDNPDTFEEWLGQRPRRGNPFTRLFRKKG